MRSHSLSNDAQQCIHKDLLPPHSAFSVLRAGSHMQSDSESLRSIDKSTDGGETTCERYGTDIGVDYGLATGIWVSCWVFIFLRLFCFWIRWKVENGVSYHYVHVQREADFNKLYFKFIFGFFFVYIGSFFHVNSIWGKMFETHTYKKLSKFLNSLDVWLLFSFHDFYPYFIIYVLCQDR